MDTSCSVPRDRRDSKRERYGEQQGREGAGQMKKLKLADLFYSLAFDNVISAAINKFVESKRKERPVPELKDVRKWARKTAKEFK